MDSLVGLTASDWWYLLKQNRFAVEPSNWHKAILLTIFSASNSFIKRKEDRIYLQEVQKQEIKKPPIFILGHWRSGTTFLHNLFVLDKQFAYPNLFQVNNPHTFLYKEPRYTKHFTKIKAEERPMDNIKIDPKSPGEEEFALGALSLITPLLAWPFPRREEYYDRYLTFKDVSKENIDKWKSYFLLFVKKLTWRYEKQLVLKSPANTGRIKLLLDLFPDAKFIHIHRNPYAVFKSTKRLYKKAVSTAYLHRPKNGDTTTGILKRYKDMYDCFFDERELIPKGNYVEVSFEELEVDLVAQMEKIYTALQLDGFDQFKPGLLEYVEANKKYKKNKYTPLEDSLREKVAKSWHKSFEQWGYEI